MSEDKRVRGEYKCRVCKTRKPENEHFKVLTYHRPHKEVYAYCTEECYNVSLKKMEEGFMTAKAKRILTLLDDDLGDDPEALGAEWIADFISKPMEERD